jgi:adenosylcobinamide-GDP ribazoletransferase
MNVLKEEVRIFFTALMFYTRIPCPKWVDHDAEYINKSTRYFPLIGYIVGGASAFIFIACSFVLSKEVSLILSFIASVLITGAFHEDGFADVCDGFGGGWTKEKILEIMKDSRVGAYGVIGLILLFLFKFLLLQSIATNLLPLVILTSHVFSRYCAVTFIATHNYVRENEDAKAKPVAKGMNLKNLIVASIFGLGAFLIFKSALVFVLIIPVYVVKIYLGYYFKKWIGGYTGDCLGATQQICEVSFYLFFCVLCRYI